MEQELTTFVFVEVLQKYGGLSLVFVAHKLLCFGPNGVSTFQGTKLMSLHKQTQTMHHFLLRFIAWPINAIFHLRLCLAWDNQ
jgi:hypothetical protein